MTKIQTCPIHNCVLKPRVAELDVTKNSVKLTEEEWQDFVDKKHQFTAAGTVRETIVVCPHCGYAERLR